MAERMKGPGADARDGDGAVRRRVGIRDVAAACGVSPATVSNALMGKRPVKESTRLRVIETAERLGYRASGIARGLRLQRSWSIGLMLANISNPFYPEIARGVEDAAAEESLNLILCNTDYESDKQDRQMRLLLERQVDGLIVGFHPETPQIRFLESTGTPFVLLNRGHGDFDADMVCAADAQASRVMVDHLVELGHRRIAYIGGHPRSENAHVRHDGFIAAMRGHGLAVDPALVAVGAYDFPSGAVAADRLLSLPEPPTAIFAASDLMAMGATKALFSKGFRVPEDISVAGIDDILIASMPGVGLTTVRIPKWDIGAAAVRLLLRRILGERDDFPATVTFPVELITRTTTAPPRG